MDITASEIAGLVVGALLLGATLAAPKVDSFVASSQRRSLGMCQKCGDLKTIACSQCKGIGSVRKGGNLFSNIVDDFYESMGEGKTPTPMVPCTKCQSKGRTICLECSKVQKNIQ